MTRVTSRNNTNTKTYVFDIQDLDNPFAHRRLYGDDGGHRSQPVRPRQSRFPKATTVRVFGSSRLGDLSVGELTEVAFLDTQPTSDSNSFNGAWTTYPFFDSGLVIVTDMGEGLFVIRPEIGEIFADGFESGDTSAWSTTVP